MAGPERGDGNLYITINDMGHGDGTIIAFPNGKKVLLDFGSRRYDTAFFTLEEEEEEPEEGPEERELTPKQKKELGERIKVHLIKNIVCDKRYLLTDPLIDVIILTHSDEDHHKVLQTLFTTQIEFEEGGWSPTPQAGTVFFSGNFKDYSVGGTNRFLAENTDYIYSVTINEEGVYYNQLLFEELTYVPEKPVQITEERVELGETFIQKVKSGVMQGFVKVLDGTADPKDPCGLYLLASNVTTDYAKDDSTEVNRGSIVSMIIGIDGEKFLFLGDATRSTETFLMTRYAEKLKNVELVQIGHHGSMSSSSEAFIRLINPKIAVVSAAYDSKDKLALPRYEVLERLEQCATNLQSLSKEAAKERRTIACYMPFKYKPRRPEPLSLKRKAESELEQERPNKKRRAAARTVDVPKPSKNQPTGNDIAEFVTDKAIWCTGSHGPIDYPDPSKAQMDLD